MSSDYRAIGSEILNELEIDPTRLGGALSALNEVVRGYLESNAWNEVSTHCESAYELCDVMQGAWEMGDMIDTFYAEGIFHAYEGISHLYQAEEAKGKKNLYEQNKELAKAIYCLEKSQQSFHFEYYAQWNEVIVWLSLGRLYRNQHRLDDALLAFEKSCTFSNFDRLSIEKMQEIVKVVSAETEKTRRLFGNQKSLGPSSLEEFPPLMQQKVIPFRLPIIDEIAAGKEKPVSDDIIGYMRRTGRLEFEYEGQALKVELLRGSQLTFLPEYDYVAMLVSGDSMDEADISPNDYVILRKSKAVPLEPSPGDIVAVVFRSEDDEATLKRFYFDKSSGNVTLKPESSNPQYKTRVLRPEAFAGENPSAAIAGIAIATLKPLTLITNEITAGEKHLLVEGDWNAPFEVLWSQFVSMANAMVVLDPGSRKVISPLKEKLSTAFDFINKESEPEEWESFVEAISDLEVVSDHFCKYTSTQMNRTLVKELRQLVAGLVSKIISNLSNYKHLASIEKQLGDIVHRLLQHLWANGNKQLQEE